MLKQEEMTEIVPKRKLKEKDTYENKQEGHYSKIMYRGIYRRKDQPE